MYAHPDKSERAQYEQRRRKAVIRDAREHRLMSRWLRKVHPETAAEFDVYHAKLQIQNPNRRDLTTAPQFVRFMREGDGTGMCFLVFSKVLCDCKVFTLCFFQIPKHLVHTQDTIISEPPASGEHRTTNYGYTSYTYNHGYYTYGFRWGGAD